MVMKMFTRLVWWVLAGTLVTGCSIFHKTAKTPVAKPEPPPRTSETVVTPDNSLSARVSAYNAVGRFVVLSFPVGRMPRLDQTLFLYRNGLKVAEVKVTGPQRDNNVVADIISGDAQAGDEVRSE
jgi:hypothetical protein